MSAKEAFAILKQLMSHISSWFDYVESRAEYEILYTFFLKSLAASKATIGEHATIAIETIVADLNSKHKFLYHYNYIGRCTFGFKGDSVCESSFSSLKSKANKNCIHGSAPIHSSVMAMINISGKKVKEKRISALNHLNRDVCWTTATSGNYLTKYALGLFTDNFDKRLGYKAYKIDNKEWLVCNNALGQKVDSHVPRFDRVRKVSIAPDGYMNCTCGKMGKYLLPCVHICRVIDKDGA